MGDQEILNRNTPELILITDSQRLPKDRFFEVVEAALCGGVDTVLVREKNMDSARLLAFASVLRELTGIHEARLIIHTQADIARAIRADGVHLSASDLDQIPKIIDWLGDDGMAISASCHNDIELGFAHKFGASFAFLSPVFPTKSHPEAPHLGIDTFKKLASEAQMPVLALGGIDTTNRQQLEGFGVAVISAILDAGDPRAAAKALSAQDMRA